MTTGVSTRVSRRERIHVRTGLAARLAGLVARMGSALVAVNRADMVGVGEVLAMLVVNHTTMLALGAATMLALFSLLVDFLGIVAGFRVMREILFPLFGPNSGATLGVMLAM